MEKNFSPFYYRGQTQTTNNLATQNKCAARGSVRVATYSNTPEYLSYVGISSDYLFDDAIANLFWIHGLSTNLQETLKRLVELFGKQ
jgi:hypothetical protein